MFPRISWNTASAQAHFTRAHRFQVVGPVHRGHKPFGGHIRSTDAHPTLALQSAREWRRISRRTAVGCCGFTLDLLIAKSRRSLRARLTGICEDKLHAKGLLQVHSRQQEAGTAQQVAGLCQTPTDMLLDLTEPLLKPALQISGVATWH